MSTADNGHDLTAELDRIENEVRRAQQVALLESVIGRADAAGDEPVAARARKALITSLYYSDRPGVEYLAPFTWLVARFDEQPSWWTSALQHSVLWTYKWIIGVAIDQPAIALPVIDDLLEGMSERYARHGHGETPVLGRRFALERAVHGALAADDLFTRWAAAPRTRYSDCSVCEPSVKMNHHIRIGRYEEALTHYWPVLEAGLSCGTQPEGMHSGAIEPLLRTGRADDAATAHLAGSRVSRTAANQTDNIGRHVLVLARAGQPARALELLEERIAALSRPESPQQQMTFAAAGAVLIRRLVTAGFEDLPVLDPEGARVAARDLGERLESMALEVAGTFDLRNGNPTMSQSIRQVLDSDDLPHLPLGASARPLPGLPPATSPASNPVARPRRAEEAVPDGVEALQRFADTGWRHGDEDRLTAAVSRWAEVGADRWTESVDTDGRVADPMLLTSLLSLDAHLIRDHGGATAGTRQDVVRRGAQAARAGAFEVDALLIEQAGAMNEILRAVEAEAEPDHLETLVERVRESVGLIDAALSRGVPLLGDGSEARARARGRAAAMAPDHESALRWTSEGLDLVSDVGPESPDEIRWTRSTLLRLRAQLAETPQTLVADLREVLRLLHDGLLPDHRAGALTHLSAIDAHEERWDDAVLHLREAFTIAADLHADGPATEVIRATTQILVGSPVETRVVVDVLEEQLTYAATTGDLAACAAIRSDLAMVHLEAGQDLEAAEVAEIGLTDLDRRDGSTHEYLDVEMVQGSLAFTAARASAGLAEWDRALRASLTAEAAYIRAGEAGLAARATSMTGHLHRQQDDTTGSLAAYLRCASLLDDDVAQGDYSMLDVAAFARRCAGSLTRRVDGGPAASVAFDAAQSFLSRIEGRLLDVGVGDPSGPSVESVRALVAWEQVSIEVDRAAMVAADGRPAEALSLLDGLDGRFVQMHEYADAIGVGIARANLHAELGHEDQATEAWGAAIREAQTHDIAELQAQAASGWATWLDEQGRSEEAGEVWETWGAPASDEWPSP